MRGTHIARGNPQGSRSIAKHVQLVSHVTQPTDRPRRDVLDDDPRRRDLLDDAGEVPPKRGPLAADPSASAGGADVLAGEASADEIHGGIVPWARDIFVPHDVRPMLREHGTTEWIHLHLPENRAEASALKTELQTSDAREERADRDGHFGTVGSCAVTSREMQPLLHAIRCVGGWT